MLLNTRAWTLLVAVLAAALGLSWLSRHGDGQPQQGIDRSATSPDARVPAPVTGDTDLRTEAPTAAVSSPPAASETLLLPDGSRVPTLNGATDAPPLSESWPADVPWSPIIGIERSDLGVDWYVHEDGSRSTTEMKWRSDLGREDALTRLARPAPASPSTPVGASPDK